MSDVRSFGSNYQMCSQSRKMSIGIAPASSATMSNVTGNRHSAKRQKGSPWISPKPLVRSKAFGEVVDTAKKVSNVADVGAVCVNVKGVKEPTAGTGLQSGNGKQKKVDDVFPGKENIKDVSNILEKGKGSTQEAGKEVRVPNDGVKQLKPMENRGKDSLKMKLWEVLRPTPPRNKELGGFGSVEEDANVMVQRDGKTDANVMVQSGGKKDANVLMQKDGKTNANVMMEKDGMNDANAMMQKDGKKDANIVTQKHRKKEDASLKPRVNSDTIETDSENPEVVVSRPVTRSLTRKRGAAVASPKGLRKKLFPPSEEKNVFSFEEKCNRGQHAATFRHLQSKTKSTGKKNLDIRRVQTSDPPPRVSNIQKALSGSKRSSNAEEISVRSGLGIAYGYQDQGRMKQAVRKNAQSSPEANESGQLGEGNNLISPDNGGKQDYLNCESAPKIANLTNEIFGPANKMKADAPLDIPSAQAKGTEKQTYIRLLGRRIVLVKDAYRLKSSQTAKEISSGSYSRRESSNDPAHSDDTLQSMRQKHGAELSTPGKRKFNRTEGELPISKGDEEHMYVTPGKRSEFSPILHMPYVPGEHMDTTPRTGLVEKQMAGKSKKVEAPPRLNYSGPSSPFCFPNEVPVVESSGDDSETLPEVGHAEKHISSHGGRETHEAVNFNDRDPTFGSPDATRLTDASQEYQEDELERAVSLFRSALEKFKNKLVSKTKKRSSEVLESTAEEIHSKFESAKSQIEKDVTNLTNDSRSKRQILEKSFKEQEEQLQLIDKKFKDEIRRHIEAYSRTVENLEADGNDLKRVIETRKASHQKLIKQVEEAVEKSLSDAQRKLISIQKEGRSKMQHLKTAISECVEDGTFF